MKHFLIATTLLLALACGVSGAAQPHRQQADSLPRAAAAASTGGASQLAADAADELEAYSDTTDTVLPPDSAAIVALPPYLSADSWERIFELGDLSLRGMLLLMALAVMVCVLAPIAALVLMFYLIFKGRRQQAPYTGQPLAGGQPQADAASGPASAAAAPEDLHTKGIRQVCLGVGLMILFYHLAGNVGFGIGALVVCVGVSNLLIARSQRQRDNGAPSGEHRFL